VARPPLLDRALETGALREKGRIMEDDEDPPVHMDFGVITGKARVPSTVVVSVPMDVTARTNARVSVETDVVGVRVTGWRGGGAMLDVTLAVEVGRRATGRFRLRCLGAGVAVEGDGSIEIEEADPICVTVWAVMGGKGSADIPVPEDLWQNKPYRAFFEGKRAREFSLSSDRGVVEAGAKTFPFKLYYSPRAPRATEVKLVIDLGDSEVIVQVQGVCCGFQGKKWGHRA
jgi:hypothetical protein